ncbi:unnamed protein product [Auanema sp. JU1783]|nr:unnamed protein product [Auanema sp. JU1783]
MFCSDGCTFPESEIRPFFFEVLSDVPVGTVVVETTVEPRNAQIFLASVRSNLESNENYTSHLTIQSSKQGRFKLLTTDLLRLPEYPSSDDEAYLYVTVVCNQKPYPLITVNVKAANTAPPQFYDEPYSINIPKDLPVGTVVNIPAVAIDWDPSPAYNVTYTLEENRMFSLVQTKKKILPKDSQGMEEWTDEQKPPRLQLKVLTPLVLPTNVTLIATDIGEPQKTTSAFITITEQKSKEEEEKIEKKVEAEENHFKARASKIHKAVPLRLPTVEDVNDQDQPVTFSQCHAAAILKENVSNGTFVTKLELLNKKEDTIIGLVDPEGTFSLTQDGEVYVQDNRIIDRELFSTIEVVAEIQNPPKMSMCKRIRLRIDIHDENDNRPVFEKEKYWYHLSDSIADGTEFATLKARDIDEDENGHVSYRLMNASSIPFRLHLHGRDAVLTTNGYIGDSEIYHLEVEAHDHGVPSRTSIAPIDVYVISSKPKTTTPATVKKNTEETVRKAEERNTNTIEPVEKKKTISPTTTERITTVRQETVPVTTTPKPTTEAQNDEKLSSTTEAPQKRVTAPRQQAAPHLVINEIITREDTAESAEYIDDDELKASEGFGFTSKNYYYEVFGDPTEDDVIGRVVAEPNPQMYGIDKQVNGIFKVDADIGEISVGRRLYNQPAGNISFSVSSTNGIRTAETVVTIFYDPSQKRNGGVPRFDQTLYKFRIPENTPPEVIGIVRAYHISAGQHSDDDTPIIKYDIVSENAELPFSVHQISGEVANEREFDHEQAANYEFRIRACLSNNEDQCGFARVLVSIDDINDNSPRYESSLQHVTLPSDLPVGSEVVRVSATDLDSGSNGQIAYAITPPSTTFAIDFDTGVIVTIASLTSSRYSILVEAFDHGTPRRSDVTEVRIEVHGTNPSAPVFEKKTYEAQLTSPVRAGSVVAKVKASDPDPGPEGKITYRFAATDDPQIKQFLSKFAINENTGVVSAIEHMTAREGPFDFEIEASDDSHTFNRRTTCILHVEILGQSSIRFLPLPVTIYISTEKAIGSVVLRASAFSNSNSPIQFKILEENSPFVMDGDLLRVAAHLFPGKNRLTVRAEADEAHVDHQLVIVIMSDRDKYPVFAQLTYDFDISQDAHFPLTIHRFDAVLQNGTINYEFFPEERSPHGLLLDELTGELVVTSDYTKENSNQDPVFVVVRARNSKFTQFYSDVGISLSLVRQKASHKFSQSVYRVELKENSPIGSIVGHPLEVFPKDDDVNFSFVPSSWFGIFKNGSIFVAQDVDLETMPVDQNGLITFVVAADTPTGRTTSKVQFHIADENEFSPTMEAELHGHVSEDATPGSTIMKIKAVDRDFTEGSHLLYKIVGGTGKNLVFIQEDGTLILGETPLDREELTYFDVNVEAIDKGGNKASTTVIIEVDDVNDNAPAIPNQPLVWNVTEGVLSSSFAIEALDKDIGKNGLVRFRILQGNADGFFRITDDAPNKASIHLLRPLDFEDFPSHQLTVEARDGGAPSQFAIFPVTVNVLNINDNAPTFKHKSYTQKVPIDLPIGFPVITVLAEDVDGDRIDYTVRGIGCDVFKMDPTGVISFHIPINKRRTGSLKCTVEASDGQHVSSVETELEVYTTAQPTVPTNRNHAPVFSQQTYDFSLHPEDKIGKTIGSVSVQDPDGDAVLFSIKPAEYRNLFDINDNGEVLLKVDPSELSQKQYSFLVRAEDWGPPIMTAVANIHVHLVGFEERVVEGGRTTPQPAPIRPSQEVSASPTVRQHEELQTSENIIPTSAKVTEPTTTRTTQKPTTSSPPVVKFTRSAYIFSLRSDAPVGTYLGSARLTWNKDIKLSLQSGKYLSVDSEGQIRTDASFSDQKIQKVDDIIIATHQGVRVAEAIVSLHLILTATPIPIGVVDSSTENLIKQSGVSVTARKPVSHNQDVDTDDADSADFHFSKKVYQAFVTEGKYSNGIKLALKPENLSTNFAGRVTYSIVEKEALPFFLTTEGNLMVFDVDREKKDSYILNIMAKTSGNPVRKAMAQINVVVLDVNDNYPEFDNHPESIGILRDTAVGSTVYKFHAVDQDDGDSGSVQFGCDGDEDYFNIDALDGTLIVGKPLTDAPSLLWITVVARDQGRPALRTHHKVSIKLFDPHSPAPVLPKNVETLRVAETAGNGTLLTTLLAGPSISRRGYEPVVYGLEKTHNGLFEMLSGGRLILSRKPLDEELGSEYRLNVTAKNSLGTDSTIVVVLIEGENASTSASTSTSVKHTTVKQSECAFDQLIYEAEIPENYRDRHRITTVKSSNCPGVIYELTDSSDTFEIDPTSGDVFSVRPLDRERQSVILLNVNLLEVNRRKRQTAEVEDAKSRLTAGQALIVLKVLDQNDNAPVFVHLNDDRFVATVHWQYKVKSAVFRVQAKDLDDQPDLSYKISGAASDVFSIDEKTGLVTLSKSVENDPRTSFELQVTVSDGVFETKAPLMIFKLSPSSNVIRLTSEMPYHKLKEYQIEKTLNQLTDSDSRVLAKQMFVDEKGHPNEQKSHILVYSVNRQTKEPYRRELLLDMLVPHASSLMSSPAKISEVSLVANGEPILSAVDIILLLLALVAVVLILLTCCWLATICKRKRYASSSKIEHEYMVDSVGAGPRPYDVEQISRHTAQTVLSNRALPDPLQGKPSFNDGTICTNRSDSTKEFANSVRERPSLLQSALARHKVHDGGLAVSVDYIDGSEVSKK